ncbi:ATP-binding protein [Acidihalobacter prosperus]|uniref:ATP/GTP-binding protein n=1 Tax=Acidihalobacter prosperus TaxID=160660 RepID=A0A1A6C5D0_9GAMM|nr:ATP-binding protein [Acidihalobacter prosperus]OBS09767.1 putative ATP/GTP-binding protein [Acidihalobacter prosperus]
MTDIDRLFSRLDALLDRLEPLLPAATPETDWDAVAFRWRRPGYLQPVRHPQLIEPDALLGIERQKSLLARNTAQFVRGLPANNALLWGSRGTGKSSLIRAMLEQFAGEGLRLIEVERRDLADLPEIVEPLYERPERFVIFSDDLSFEADDPSYKALKATLDGSVAAAPDNVLIYATSNRRHLLPEYQRDNLDTRVADGEIHHGEAVEEKISLSERFGLWIGFHAFRQEDYLGIVYHTLQRMQVAFDEETVRPEALRFALERGSRSGRVAAQFARDWAGRNAL